jgi:choline dehydrogenase-like flavoprotein
VLIPANRLPDGDLRADVLIVGAGPAGIVTALELGRAGIEVVLLESGGVKPDPAVQRLGDTAGEDPPHAPMSLASSRQVGGASNLWGGRCVPYDPIDFEPRPQVEAEWPVDYDSVRPLIGRACEWLVCGRPVFDVREIPHLAARQMVPGLPEGDVRTTSLERWSLPTNFARQYVEELERSRTVRLVPGLTCTEVVCRPDGTAVDHLRLANLGGRSVRARARSYVLATGGVETTRLLLASDGVHPGGIGNHSGHLGRWYQAHVEVRIARVRFARPPIHDHERDVDGVYVRRRLSFDPEVLRREELPNGIFWLVNPEVGDAAHGSGILSFVYLMLRSPLGRFFVAPAIREAHLETTRPPSLRQHLRNVVQDLPSTAAFAVRFAYQRYLAPGRKVPGFFVESAADTYPVLFHAEHLPNRDSVVELSDERDALGMRRVRTRLRFADREIEDAIRAHERLDAYLRAHGAGCLEYLTDDARRDVQEQLFGGYHQAGTTRMSTDPADGVVDADLAVHGVPNLFVNSGSSLPTSGQANTTLMIIAFAIRLADHLRGLPR